MLKMSFYAVAKGRNPGIYHSWDECQAQIHQFSGAKFKKFCTQSEAEDFVKKYQHSSIAIEKKRKTTNEISSSSVQPSKKQFLLSNKQSMGITNQKPCKQTLLEEYKNYIHIPPMCKQSEIDQSENQLVQSTLKDANYIMDEDGYINVFTDGACSSNGQSYAQAGIGVWFGDNHPLNVSKPVKGRPTNNMAEIQAVTVAAKQARKTGIKKLRINTDSKFIILCVTKWMPKWKKNGWMTASKKPVINKTELLEMEEALKPLEVIWNHVNGHVGIYGNEMADKLARQGCADYKNPRKQ